MRKSFLLLIIHYMMTSFIIGQVTSTYGVQGWAVDENCSASGPRFEGATLDDWRNNTSHTVTISNNIIAEGLSNSTHSKGEHSKGSLIHDNTSEIAVLNNLYAHNKDRNPLFKGGARGVVVNNYIYNPGVAAVKFGLVDSEWLGYEQQTGQMSVVGNVLQYGPSTGSVVLCNIGNGPCEVFLAENLSKDRSGNPVTEYKGDATKRVSSKPVWNENIQVIPTLDVQNNIQKNAGARPWDRDDTDNRILHEMLTGTGSIIDSETSVGGYPTDTPISSPFNENDWNLECMLRRSTNVSINFSTSGSSIQKDSLLVVSASLRSEKNTLELLLNGKSLGKRTEAPYKWQVLIPDTGHYQLIVITDADSTFKLASETTHIQVLDSLPTSIQKSTLSSFVSTYPNPFKESICIKYELSETGFVQAGIFNVRGSLIKPLVSQTQSIGQQELNWSPKRLTEGMYFSILKTRLGTSCQKLVYLKP